MKTCIDLTGQTFGRLLVTGKHHSKSNDGHTRWSCTCSCGTEKVVTRNDLTKGSTQSCGCLASDNTSKRARKHGYKGTKFYEVWHGMLARCFNPSHFSYYNYGAKGITVCESWKSFENFLRDMHDGYDESLQIDRIDTYGNYEPGNCRWVTPAENARNKTTSKLTCEDVGLIRSILMMPGAKLADLSEAFDVSKGHICSIGKEKIWNGITPSLAY